MPDNNTADGQRFRYLVSSLAVQIMIVLFTFVTPSDYTLLDDAVGIEWTSIFIPTCEKTCYFSSINKNSAVCFFSSINGWLRLVPVEEAIFQRSEYSPEYVTGRNIIDILDENNNPSTSQ